MKKTPLILFASLSMIFSCSDHDDLDVNVSLDQSAIKENAKTIFGDIDPSQNWSSITKGTVNILANAEMENIVKVQILTESPFGQTSPIVLNETEAKNNETVSLVYDAPNVYKVLFAACVDNKGKYFVKAFNIGEKEVNFSEPAASRMTRSGEGFPSLSKIVLGEPAKSFNALRAEASKEVGYVVINDDSKNNAGGTKRRYSDWNNDSWLNDFLWAPVNATDNNWVIENGTIYKNVNESVDLTTMQWLVRFYLPKTGAEIVSSGNKSNNWKSIVEGTNYFKEHKNHFVSDGNPLTVVPLQMNTTEGQYNNIYYYYFSRDSINGKTDQEIANFIKKLPKFKAIAGYNGGDAFKREKKYLLPYYGDSIIKAGDTPKSLIIPEGYLIGFMNQKANGDSYNFCMNGCTYGYGPLNTENNHIVGHYFSAMSTEVSQTSLKNDNKTEIKYGSTPSGMTWDSPRIGIFSANNKAYLCFEDGSDCNFSDMIIEIASGVVVKDEAVKPAAASYIMCFEDEPEVADYDMNDVVLRGVRLNDSQIEISLIACGAYDKLEIKGLQNTKLFLNKEIHKLFKVTPGEKFINTVKGENYFTPVSEIFNIDKSISIEDFMSKITVKNVSTGKTIGMPKAGEAPYAIIMPMSFRYPIEKCCITNAYPDFKKWAQNRTEATDWYLGGRNDLLYPDMFAE